MGGEFVFGPGYAILLLLTGMVVDSGSVIDFRVKRLKSSFVHKMQNPRGHAPIVEVLEAAGVEVCEKVKVRGPEVRSLDLAPTTPTSEVVEIGIAISTSTPEPSLVPSLATTTTFQSETTSTAKLSTSSNGNDMRLELTIPVRPLEPEPPTPVIADEVEWMAHRSQHLTKIKQRKEARRKGCREDWSDDSAGRESFS